jgi:molybdopterin-guanine dinucleotide biosynthesis protein A
MGQEKARVPWRGVPMAERVADALTACVTPVRVVVRPGAAPPVELPSLEDRLSSRAPIAGIHSALLACRASAVLVAACDLPEIAPPLLLALIALTASDGDVDVIVPVGPRGPEPLLAVYRPTIVQEIEERVDRGELSLRGLLASVRTLEVDEPILRRFDPELRSLRNVNRPEDL